MQQPCSAGARGCFGRMPFPCIFHRLSQSVDFRFPCIYQRLSESVNFPFPCFFHRLSESFTLGRRPGRPPSIPRPRRSRPPQGRGRAFPGRDQARGAPGKAGLGGAQGPRGCWAAPAGAGSAEETAPSLVGRRPMPKPKNHGTAAGTPLSTWGRCYARRLHGPASPGSCAAPTGAGRPLTGLKARRCRGTAARRTAARRRGDEDHEVGEGSHKGYCGRSCTQPAGRPGPPAMPQ